MFWVTHENFLEFLRNENLLTEEENIQFKEEIISEINENLDLAFSEETITSSKNDELGDLFETFEYQYINNLCENLQSPELFCDKYLSNSYWNKIVNGQKETVSMRYRCETLLNKKKLRKKASQHVSCNIQCNHALQELGSYSRQFEHFC